MDVYHLFGIYPGCEQRTITCLQRRAGQYRSSGQFTPATDPASQLIQPGPAILVRQCLPGRHLLLIGARVKIISIMKLPAQRCSQRPANRRLTATSYPHKNNNHELATEISSLLGPLTRSLVVSIFKTGRHTLIKALSLWAAITDNRQPTGIS